MISVFSKCWRGIRDLWQICGWANGSPCFLCGTSDWCISRSHDRLAGIKELRTTSPRATSLVGGAWCLCGLHNFCNYVQSHASRLSMTRGQLRVWTTAKFVTRSWLISNFNTEEIKEKKNTHRGLNGRRVIEEIIEINIGKYS